MRRWNAAALTAAALQAALLVNPACTKAPEAGEKPVTHGTYRLRTFPAGAKVWVDGELKVDATPATLLLPAGTYRLKIQLEGAEPLEKTIEIEAGEAEDVTLTIPRPPDATITVLSDVVGATVRVNGYVRGRTPLQKAITLPGPLDITVVTPEGRARSMRGVLKLSEQKVIEVFFERAQSDADDGDDEPEPAMSAPAPKGFLTLGLYPDGEVLDARGQLLGKTPLHKKPLPAGDHLLLLRSADGRYEREVMVTIEPNQEALFRFRLLESDKKPD